MSSAPLGSLGRKSKNQSLGLDMLGTVLSTDSLSCTFTVKYRSSPGQCSVNGKPLLLFNDERQNSPVGKPEKKGNATKVCAELNQSLKDIFQKMMNLESWLFESKGNHTLQVTVQSQYNQGIFMDGCWVFTIDRQYPFYFYPKIMTWRESHPDASRTVSQWQNNRQVAQSLRTCSMGDFSQCLRKLLTDSREVPRSTITTLDPTQPSSAIQIPPTVDSASSVFTTWSQYIFVLILCLAILIINALIP
uniref:Retinoic acid early-inducible protein 1 domain-containing protein n=1 Tax=Rattus norvegicus TaxID=10116 RepID=M0RCY4_RAT